MYFTFDLQRFANEENGKEFSSDSAASSAGYKIRVDYNDSANTVRYFDNMQYAMNSLVGNANSSFKDGLEGSNYKLASGKNSATVTLLGNITNGVGFIIGQINGSSIVTKGVDKTHFNYTTTDSEGGETITSVSMYAATKVEIDLKGYTYTFATPLTKTNSTVNKSKGIQIVKPDSGTATTTVTIKDGTLNIAEQTTGGELFERLIRSYADLTLNNVTVDGRNVRKQESGEDGAVICHSVGNLTLSGTTSVLVQDDTEGNTYYAVTGKLGNNRGNADGYNIQYAGGFTINVETTGKDRNGNDAAIKNIGLFGWSDTSQTAKAATSGSWQSSGFTASNAKLNLKSGNVGEVTFSKTSVDVLDASLANNFSLGGGTAGITLGSFKYDSAGSDILYQKAANSLYTLAQVNSWNAVSTAENNKAYNYVTKANNTDTKGTITLNVTGVEDKEALKIDEAHKILGIPQGATPSLASGTDYKTAVLDYDRNKEAVIISSATAGAEIYSGNYTLNPGNSSSVTGAGILADTVKKIDASDLSVAANIVANSLDNTIYGGKGQTFTGGKGADTFVYSGGGNTIADYTIADKDLVSVTSDIEPVTSGAAVKASDNDLVIGFSTNNSLTLTGGATVAGFIPNVGVSISSGNKNYIYNKNYIAEGKSLTLTAGFDVKATNQSAPAIADDVVGYDAPNNIGGYYTVDGSAVTHSAGLALLGDSANNYYIGSTTKSNTLYGGTGNDTLVGGTVGNTFQYTDGKDVIVGYDFSKDKVNISSAKLEAVTSAKAGNDKLTFTIDSKNALTFSGKDAESKISLESGGYFTKDGVVTTVTNTSGSGTEQTSTTTTTLKLFSGAKGDIDITNENALYKDQNITAIDASKVTGQAVNLIGGTAGGSFTFNATNKKKDTFTYGGGDVTITGYETGNDKLNLGDNTITSFTVKTGDDAGKVELTLSNKNKVLLDSSVAGGEVLIHDGNSKSDNSYGKTIFLTDNVLADKKTPTSATVMSGATAGFNAATTAPTVKKIFAGTGLAGVQITAGNTNNSTVDASAAGTEAGNAITLVGGNKNDKLIGSKYADVFKYTKGKDVIQNYEAGKDSIAFDDGSSYSAITAATKIAASDKSIKLTFGTGDVLNVKGTGLKSGGITVGTTKYTFGKNAIISSVTPAGSDTARNQATLTSAASGSVKTKNFTDVKYFDGQKVTKNLTFTGGTDAETLIGGQKKTVFKGGGGNDSLVGGDGKDTFFYAKGNEGNATIASFGFGEDNLKIANGTISKISSVAGGVQFSMTDGKKKNPTDKGTFLVSSYATVTTVDGETVPTTAAVNAGNVVIKANSTYYWFEDSSNTTGTLDNNVLGKLVTSTSKVSADDVKGYSVIDLTYSTNLVKSTVATAVEGISLTKKTTNQPAAVNNG